jgi:hypothetical protein
MLAVKHEEVGMWVYAEVVSRDGSVLSRAEGDVTEEGDLAALVKTATDHFRKGHPENELLADIEHSGCTIRLGKP